MADYAIVVCTLGKVRWEWALENWIGSAMPIGHKRYIMGVRGMPTNDARNHAFTRACELDLDYLMFWDDDIIVRNEGAMNRLFTLMHQNPDLDIVSGVYPCRRDIPEPLVQKEDHGGVWWGWEEEITPENGKPHKVHTVYMTGTGFTFYRMSAMRKVELEPYEYINYNEDGTKFKTLELRQFMRSAEAKCTDDFDLAERAKEAGLKWVVDGDVICDQIDLETGKLWRIEDARVKV